jgi:hypothetical protein
MRCLGCRTTRAFKSPRSDANFDAPCFHRCGVDSRGHELRDDLEVRLRVAGDADGAEASAARERQWDEELVGEYPPMGALVAR